MIHDLKYFDNKHYCVDMSASHSLNTFLFKPPNIYLQNLCNWGQRTIFLEFMMTRCDRNCLLFDNFSPVTGACWCWMCWMSQDLINPDSALISRLSPASVSGTDCGKRIAHRDIAGEEQIVVYTKLQFRSCSAGSFRWFGFRQDISWYHCFLNI